MKINRKFLIILLFTVTISVIANATISKATDQQYVNLKVLPKNINSKDLQKIMVDFEDDLGVACIFCHSADKTTGELDFVSDAKPEKEIARLMIRMTIGINKKYFKVKHPMIGTDALTITCNTCHNGTAFPDGK